jgi:hypothetical protein
LKEDFHQFEFDLHKEKEMVDFRKSILLLALLVICGALANAQVAPALQCVANAGVPPIIRAEGVADQVGDLVLNCNGGTPTANGAVIPKVNIQIFLNTNITSRLLADPWSEGIVIIDEPNSPSNPGSPLLQCGLTGSSFNLVPQTCDVLGTGTGIGVYSGFRGTGNVGESGFVPGRPNVYQGRQAAPNSLVWLGVPVDPPGTLTTRIIRITNVRAHAAGLAGSAQGLIPATVTMFVSVTGATSIPINQPQQTVAFIQPGMTFSVVDPVNLLQCFSVNSGLATNPANTAGVINMSLRYAENFATSFKVRSFQTDPLTVADQNVPGGIYNTESMFVNQFGTYPFGSVTGRGNLAIGGQATQGTRLMAKFNNVPTGVRLYVTIAPTAVVALSGGTTTISANLVATAPDGSGPYSAMSASSAAPAPGIAEVVTIGGTGQAVWEIIHPNVGSITNSSSIIERLQFGVLVAYVSNTSAGLPALGTATVNGSFAPLTTITTASATAPVPRFVDVSTARNIFTITACVCNLLFPFVSNQGGFDTGIAISNTTADIFGTPGQTGTVTINYFGTSAGGGAAPPAAVSSAIAAGAQLIWTLSTGNTAQSVPATPGFQGYLMTTARFQFCHGFAFISDIGAQKLAMGYLALVLDLPTLFRTANVGESLGQ